MAQDIRDLFDNDEEAEVTMPMHHEKRFLEKLDKAMPKKKASNFGWLKIAASIVLLLGISFGVYKNYKSPKEIPNEIVITNPIEKKSLGDVSPALKKVEDYYLASIHLELSKIEYTPETKELFDGYLEQLSELNKEYERLSLELTASGPSELMVNALIDNLKFRLKLLYRLKDQLKKLDASGIDLETST